MRIEMLGDRLTYAAHGSQCIESRQTGDKRGGRNKRIISEAIGE